MFERLFVLKMKQSQCIYVRGSRLEMLVDQYSIAAARSLKRKHEQCFERARARAHESHTAR